MLKKDYSEYHVKSKILNSKKLPKDFFPLVPTNRRYFQLYQKKKSAMYDRSNLQFLQRRIQSQQKSNESQFKLKQTILPPVKNKQVKQNYKLGKVAVRYIKLSLPEYITLQD